LMSGTSRSRYCRSNMRSGSMMRDTVMARGRENSKNPEGKKWRRKTVPVCTVSAHKSNLARMKVKIFIDTQHIDPSGLCEIHYSLKTPSPRAFVPCERALISQGSMRLAQALRKAINRL
jgi:hypothetical protein